MRTPIHAAERRNENANGLLREYFPKKTDLAAICEEDLNKVLFIDHENI